jgi:dienelactone hydrolase
MNRATEDQFNELHGLVTNELIARIKSGTATTQDIKAAADWLAKNNITGLAITGSPLATLFESLELELEDVEQAIR